MLHAPVPLNLLNLMERLPSSAVIGAIGSSPSVARSGFPKFETIIAKKDARSEIVELTRTFRRSLANLRSHSPGAPTCSTLTSTPEDPPAIRAVRDGLENGNAACKRRHFEAAAKQWEQAWEANHDVVYLNNLSGELFGLCGAL